MNRDISHDRAHRAPTAPGKGVRGTAPSPFRGAAHRSPGAVQNTNRAGRGRRGFANTRAAA